MAFHELRSMAKSIVLWALLSLPVWASGQSAYFDSINEANLLRIRRLEREVIRALHQTRIDAEQRGQALDQAGAFKNVAAYYIVFDQRDSALHYLDRGLQASESDSTASVRASLFINKGILLYKTGQHAASYSAYLRALRIAERLQDSARAANVLLNMAVTDSDLRRYSQAIERVKQAVEWRKGDHIFESDACSNLGICYLQLGDTAEAVAWYQKGIALSQEVGNLNALANSKFNLANVLARTENKQQARQYYSEALSIFDSLGLNQGRATAYSAFGTMEFHEGNYAQALEYYLKCYELSQDYPRLRYEVETNLSLTYEALGDFKNAFYFLEHSITAKDSLSGVEMQAQISRMQQEYQLDKLVYEGEREQLQAEQRELILSRRIAWLSAALFLSSALLVFLSFRKSLRRQQAEKRELLAQQEKEQLELQLIRSQMNPHFFFNALYSIQNFILTNNPLESSRFLSKFSRLMRATLEWNEKEFIPIDKEIQGLTDYLELEQLRFDNNFDFQIHCEDHLRQEAYIPPMIVQPFVENAVVHGFKDRAQGGVLEISFQEANNCLVVEVKDNGSGLQQGTSKQVDKKSMALRLTRKRLELLSHQMGGHFGFTVKDRGTNGEGSSGVYVHLTLPLIRY